MTSNPTAHFNSSSDPSSNNNSTTSSSHSSAAFPHQIPSDLALTSPSNPRFNSFALPRYPHSAGPLDTAAPTSSASSSFAFAHPPFSASSNPSVAEPSSRHLSISSTASLYHPQQQQQPPSSQLLHPSSTTPSSSSFAGSAVQTAGGGGGSGSAGSGIPNLSLGQIHLLIVTINDRNYDTKWKEIQRVRSICIPLASLPALLILVC